MAKKRRNNDNLIKSMDSLYRLCAETFVCLSFLALYGVYINGLTALRVILAGTVTAYIVRATASKITKKDSQPGNIYALCTGMMIALMLPATSPLYLPIIGSFFAVLVATVPFGSERKLIFIPSAAGFAFLCVCFPREVFAYAPVNIFSSSPTFGADGFVAAKSLAGMLKDGEGLGMNLIRNTEILTGRIPGALGTTCIVGIIGAAVYFIIRKPKKMIISLSYLIACIVCAAVYHRAGIGVLSSVFSEICAGSLLFCAVFLLPDFTISPQKPIPGIIYGFSAGALTMLLRYFGKFEEGAVFAVLIVNAFYPVCGDWLSFKNKKDKKDKTENKHKEKKALSPAAENIPAEEEAADDTAENTEDKKEDDDDISDILEMFETIEEDGESGQTDAEAEEDKDE